MHKYQNTKIKTFKTNYKKIMVKNIQNNRIRNMNDYNI